MKQLTKRPAAQLTENQRHVLAAIRVGLDASTMGMLYRGRAQVIGNLSRRKLIHIPTPGRWQLTDAGLKALDHANQEREAAQKPFDWKSLAEDPRWTPEEKRIVLKERCDCRCTLCGRPTYGEDEKGNHAHPTNKCPNGKALVALGVPNGD